MFPYELCWLNYILASSIEHIVGINTKVSDLEMSADDVYSAIVQYRNKVVGSIHIDLLNRKAGRTLRLIGSKGTIEWDWLGYEIRVLLPNRKPRIIKLNQERKFTHYNTTEGIYTAEIKDFVDAITGKKIFPYSFKEDWSILRTLYAVENNFKRLKSQKLW